MTSVCSPSINDCLHSPWQGLVELLVVFGNDRSPKLFQRFFQAHILNNLVLLVTLKQIEIEMPGWSYFEDLFRTFPTVTNFLMTYKTFSFVSCKTTL